MVLEIFQELNKNIFQFKKYSEGCFTSLQVTQIGLWEGCSFLFHLIVIKIQLLSNFQGQIICHQRSLLPFVLPYFVICSPHCNAYPIL